MRLYRFSGQIGEENAFSYEILTYHIHFSNGFDITGEGYPAKHTPLIGSGSSRHIRKDDFMAENASTPAQIGEGQALVIGAGIAGLLVARVLADMYQRVLIVERDAVSARPGP